MDDEYVGYKKPPRQHQFQPGQSGNSGRRKAKEPIDAEKLLGAPVHIVRNGRRMAVDPRHLALESQFKKAFKNELHAARAIVDRIIAAGLLRVFAEDDHQYCLHIPWEWERDDWMASYRQLGPPPWPGERDGLVPIERRDKRKRQRS